MGQINLDANRGHELLVSVISLELLATVAVCLRFVAKRMGKLPWAIDDWMILLALCLVYGIIPIMVIAVRAGMGKHVAVVGPLGVETTFKADYACEILYGFYLSAIKASVLLFYRRIFATARFRFAVNVVGAAVAAWMIAIVLIAAFQCSPVSFAWDQSGPGKCIKINRFIMWNAATNIILDMIILALPLRMIWKLQLPNHKKFALCGIFLLGGFVTVSSIVRFTYLNNSITSDDPTWVMVPSAIWSTVEPCIGIVCACLPSYGPIFRGPLSSFVSSIRLTIKQSTIPVKLASSTPKKSWPSTSTSTYTSSRTEDDSKRHGGHRLPSFELSENPGLIEEAAPPGLDDKYNGIVDVW